MNDDTFMENTRARQSVSTQRKPHQLHSYISISTSCEMSPFYSIRADAASTRNQKAGKPSLFVTPS